MDNEPLYFCENNFHSVCSDVSQGTQLTQASAPHQDLPENVFWSETQPETFLVSKHYGTLVSEATNRGDNVGRACLARER